MDTIHQIISYELNQIVYHGATISTCELKLYGTIIMY